MTNRYDIVIGELKDNDDDLLAQINQFVKELDVETTEEASVVCSKNRPVSKMKKMKKRTGTPKTTVKQRKKAKEYRKKHKNELEKKAKQYRKKNKNELKKRAKQRRK